MEDHVILGVHITQRLRNARQVQEALTEFGGNIKTRLGLHEVGGDQGSPNGLLVLELVGGESRARELTDRLGGIEGVYCRMMVFDHPA